MTGFLRFVRSAHSGRNDRGAGNASLTPVEMTKGTMPALPDLLPFDFQNFQSLERGGDESFHVEFALLPFDRRKFGTGHGILG